MRAIGRLKDPERANRFSRFLHAHGIDNRIEGVTNNDWGSDDYGTLTITVWVLDEEQWERASEWLSYFKEHPDDPRFKTAAKEPEPSPPPPENREPQQETLVQKLGLVTFIILAVCGALFLIGNATRPPIKGEPPEKLPLIALYGSPVNDELMYDYPKAYRILDQLQARFGIAGLREPETLPPEGKALLDQFNQTPYWEGIYDKIVLHIRKPGAPWNFKAPMFEEIRRGQLWRLLTPCFLHFDIFHIFFNMIWLIVLGKQIEKKLGPWRYILLIIAAGIFSNTAQYLMSGPNFIGFSGVVCGMIAFIWARQRYAAWEGYELQRATIVFISAFILAVLGLQIAFFILEVLGRPLPFSGMIANTAHLTGALAGFLLGRSRYFAWRTIKK